MSFITKARHYQIGWVVGILLCFGGQSLAEEGGGRLVGAVGSQLGSQEDRATVAAGSQESPPPPPGKLQGKGEQSGSAKAEEQTGTTASAPSTSPAGVIDISQLVGLPMNGRSYTQLTTLSAGISDPTGGGRQGGGSSSLTVSGGRGTWNSFLLDGTDINGTDNQVPRSAAGGQLGADAVLEVQVFSTTYGAQYGRAAGGVMNAITRSGTDEWHGTVFEFFRNSKLDARNFFDAGPEPPPFKRNQFGGTLAGPVAKGSTYFMVSFEALRDRLTETFPIFVPDEGVRNGDLSLPGKAPLIVAPEVLPYVNLYPSADRPVLDQLGRPTGIAENRLRVWQPTNEYFFVARFDQRLGDQDAWFARYTFDDAVNLTAGTTVPHFPQWNESRQQYLTLTETHFFSAARLNVLRLSFTRPVSQTLPHPEVKIPPELFFVPGAPQFGGILVGGLSNLSEHPLAPFGKVMNSFQFSDEFLNSRGAHTLRLGMLAERFQWTAFDSESMGGRWTFNSLESLLRAGKGPEDSTTLRVALPGSISDRAFRQSLFAFYLQDDYKLLPNLTFNLGLRYEFTTMIHDAKGRDVFLRDELRDSVPQVGRLMGENPALHNLAPRVGLSWSLGKERKTVLRVGAGIFYDPIIEYSVDALRDTIPFFKLALRTDIQAPEIKFPDAVATAGVPNQLRLFEYQNPKTPTVYRYTFSLQREWKGALRLEASYVGARGNHLLRSIEANLFPFPERSSDGSLYFPPNRRPMNPAFGSIWKTLTDAQSFYNSFLFSVKGNLGSGFSLGANYTYSRSVDDASELASNANPKSEQNYGLDRTLNRGLSSFDLRHRFSLNYFYSLPFGPAQRWLKSRWMASVLGSWRLGGILSLRAGSTAQVQYAVAVPGFLFVSQRPNLVPGRSNNPVSGTTGGCAGVQTGRKLGGPDLYFDPCAFSVPRPGTIGNVGRNTLIGPPMFSLDLSLQKDFALDSKRRLQFRAELFNLSNHPNFLAPNGPNAVVFRNAAGTVSPNAGKLTNTVNSSRQIQFAIRLSY